MANKNPIIALAAGGSGGHLFPAEALAAELAQRGFEPHLLTDARARRFVSYFDDAHSHIIRSSTIAGKNPLRLIRALQHLCCGLRQSRRLLKRLAPRLVIGFGGYPTLPPLYMATRLGIPTLIHEQNAVMGRANRFLSRNVSAIAGGFLAPHGPHADKIVLTGNPLRQAVIEVTGIPYQPAEADAPFNLLIFGGSQGASFFSHILPQALALLAPTQRARLQVTQQARVGEMEPLKQAYEELHIAAEIAPFFDPMAERMAQAHFIIARSGASTVAEIAAIGRPSLLVPYPGALDHDQAENAKHLGTTGAAWVKTQADLNAETLAAILAKALDNPIEMAEMAVRAGANGQPQATEQLADLVEKLIA